MRTLEELIDHDDPSLPLIEEWVEDASTTVELLPAERVPAEATLHALQVTTRSALGGLAYHTGGILVDDGWLRILGGGSPRMPRTLASWNQIGEPRVRLPGAMLVGDDVLGGFFAIDGGAFGGTPGHVWYLAPDTLDWECLDRGHTDWLHWALTGDLHTFYETMRWPGWEAEVAALAPTHAISFRSRQPTLIEQLWSEQLELRRQILAAN